MKIEIDLGEKIMKKLINRIKFEIYFFNAIRAQKKRYKKFYPNGEDMPGVFKNAF